MACRPSYACRANIAHEAGHDWAERPSNVGESPCNHRDASADRPTRPLREVRPRGGITRAASAVSGWLALLAAGLLEIVWALGLKHSDGFTRFWPTAATAVAIILSFTMMSLALRSLPFGTAYAVWTGIGAVGSIVVGMLLYSEPIDPVRLICLTLIVAGMIGLKLNSPA